MNFVCFANTTSPTASSTIKSNARDPVWDEISIAAQEGDLREFARLVSMKKRRDPDFTVAAKDPDGKTFAHFAAATGKLNIIQYIKTKEKVGLAHILTGRLIDFMGKASVTVRDKSGKQPLHNACENGNIELIKYLLLLVTSSSCNQA